MRLQDIIARAKQAGDPYIIQDVTELEGQALCNAPELRFRETSQSLPAGLWRWRLTGDVYKLERNTHASGDFSTLTTPIQINASDQVGIGGSPSQDLHVYSASASVYFYLQSAVAGGQALLLLENDAREWRVGVNTADAFQIKDQTGGNTPFYIVQGAISNLLYLTGSKVFINETANAKMTVGLTINQGASDDEILSLKSSDVAHGGYLAESDSFARFIKQDASAGGLGVQGFRDSDGGNYQALGLTGWLDEAPVTSKGGSSRGVVSISAYYTNGGALQNMPANSNLVDFMTYIGSSYRTVALLDAEGDLHLDTTLTQNAWDDYDDLALLHGLRASMMPAEHELRRRFGHFIEQARPVLEATGCITYNDHEGGDGSVFIAMKKLQMLTIDALRQLGERNRQLEVKVERLEQKLLTA